MKRLIFSIIFLLMFSVNANAAIILDYADNQPEGHPAVEAAKKFASLVKTGTSGRVTVKLHINGTLSNEERVLKQLKFGTIDVTRVSVPYLANDYPEFQVLQMPYLFESDEHMRKVFESSIGEHFSKIPERDGVISLAWFDAGARSFYTTKKPIKTLEDFKLLKIRTQTSEVATEMVRVLGALPMPIPYGEVSGALFAGDVDGAENNFSSYMGMGHNEAAKYYTLTEHLYQPELIVISKEALEELTPQDRQIVRSAAKEAAKYERALWAASEKKAMEQAIATGTIIIKLSPEEKNKIKAALKKLEKEYDANEQAFIEEIRKVK